MGDRRDMRQMARLALPATLSFVSFALMELVDCAILGLVGVASMAGVSLAVTLIALALAYPIGMLRALAPLAAGAAGRFGNGPRWGETLGKLLRLGWAAPALLGGGATLVGWAALLVLRKTGYEPAMLQEMERFIVWRAPAFGLDLWLVGWWALCEGLGDTRTPLWAGLSANAVNVALSTLLVSGAGALPGLGVVGAALATNVANLAGIAVLALGLRRKIRSATANRGKAWPVPEARNAAGGLARAFVRLGWPLGISGLIHVAGWLLLGGLLAKAGSHQAAAHGILCRVLALGLAAAEGLGVAAVTLVAQALGRRRRALAARRARLVVSWALLLATAVGMGLVVSARRWAPLFSTDPRVLAALRTVLPTFAGILWLEGLLIVLASIVEGIGRTRLLLAATVLFDLMVAGLLLARFDASVGLADFYSVWLGKDILKLVFLAASLVVLVLSGARRYRRAEGAAEPAVRYAPVLMISPDARREEAILRPINWPLPDT